MESHDKRQTLKLWGKCCLEVSEKVLDEITPERVRMHENRSYYKASWTWQRIERQASCIVRHCMSFLSPSDFEGSMFPKHGGICLLAWRSSTPINNKLMVGSGFIPCISMLFDIWENIKACHYRWSKYKLSSKHERNSKGIWGAQENRKQECTY